MHQARTIAAAAAAGVLILSGEVNAAEKVRRNYDQPAQFSATIQATGCTAEPGPQFTANGELTLAGLKTSVIFSNPGGPQNPVEPVVIEQVVVPTGETVAIPAQSVVGGVGPNPIMWLQLTDHAGRPLTSEIFLGRCDQAQFTPTAMIVIPAEFFADASTTDCQSATPSLSLDGATQLSGVNGKLILRSSSLPHPQGMVDKEVVELVLVQPGQSFEIPQQAVVGGAGENPLISLQLRQGNGEPIGSEITLGRCAVIAN